MKTISSYFLGILTIFSFANCASGQKLQETAPVDFQQAYYTSWVGGVRGAGSGINLFIPVLSTEDNDVELDSVYFRGKRAELETKPQDENLYIAHFQTPQNRRTVPDIVMSSDPREEYGNKVPEIIQEFPFDLEEDEAVVSFRKNGKKGYYKIEVVEKPNNDVEIKYPENNQH